MTHHYQIYRGTTLGIALQASIDELVSKGNLPDNLVKAIQSKFDACMQSALETRVKNKVQFKGKLENFRLCDDVWTFIMKDVEFKGRALSLNVDQVKIVAVDGNPSVNQRGFSRKKIQGKDREKKRQPKRKNCFDSEDEQSFEETSASTSISSTSFGKEEEIQE